MKFKWRDSLGPSAVQPDARELTSATLQAGDIVANGDVKYNIRRIQNVELVPSHRQGKDFVDVYIGYEDPNKHTMFTRIAVDRVFAGSTPRSSGVYDFFRNEVRRIGIPVIDVSS